MNATKKHTNNIARDWRALVPFYETAFNSEPSTIQFPKVRLTIVVCINPAILMALDMMVVSAIGAKGPGNDRSSVHQPASP